MKYILPVQTYLQSTGTFKNITGTSKKLEIGSDREKNGVDKNKNIFIKLITGTGTVVVRQLPAPEANFMKRNDRM